MTTETQGVVHDNVEEGRFELRIGDHVAFALYRRQPSVLVIMHVEAPIPLRGTGAAGELMEGIMAIARGEGRGITPLCGYARSWILRHKAHRDLLV